MRRWERGFKDKQKLIVVVDRGEMLIRVSRARRYMNVMRRNAGDEVDRLTPAAMLSGKAPQRAPDAVRDKVKPKPPKGHKDVSNVPRCPTCGTMIRLPCNSCGSLWVVTRADGFRRCRQCGTLEAPIEDLTAINRLSIRKMK
jgi:hypothetical protein